MGALTLNTVMSEATASIGNRSDMPQSRASLYANLAYQYIWNTIDHQYSEAIAVSSTTSGENRITLPSDYEHTFNLSNISESPPQPIYKWNWNDVDSSMTWLGPPTNYVEYGGWVELWPSPDSAYSLQLRYKVRPSILTLGTSVGSLSTRLDYLWILTTGKMCADALKDWETSAQMAQKAAAEAATIPSDYALRQRARQGMRISMTEMQQESSESATARLASMITTIVF